VLPALGVLYTRSTAPYNFPLTLWIPLGNSDGHSAIIIGKVNRPSFLFVFGHCNGIDPIVIVAYVELPK